MDDNKNKPTTIAEAVNRLLSDLPFESKNQIQNSSENGLINFHLGLGVGIRNEFGLWNEDSKLLEDCKRSSGNPNLHVDDTSGIIIKALWKRLQEYPPPKLVRDKDQYGY